jgi:hypothetical protein
VAKRRAVIVQRPGETETEVPGPNLALQQKFHDYCDYNLIAIGLPLPARLPQTQ